MRAGPGYQLLPRFAVFHAGEQSGEYAYEEDVPADRAEEQFQRLAQVAERFHLDAVGLQDFRADDPDRQVDDDTDEYRKQQVVAHDASGACGHGYIPLLELSCCFKQSILSFYDPSPSTIELHKSKVPGRVGISRKKR